MRAGLDAPLPAGPLEALGPFEHRHRGHRIGRMQIDQRAERLRPLPERMERRVVEILPVGVAVDHGADEAELARATLELVGRRLGVLQGEMGEAGIAVRALGDLAGEEVVRLLRPADRGRGIALDLHPGAGDARARRARCRRGPSPRAACRRNRRAATPPACRGRARYRRPWSSSSPRSPATGNVLRERSSRPCGLHPADCRNVPLGKALRGGSQRGYGSAHIHQRRPGTKPRTGAGDASSGRPN